MALQIMIFYFGRNLKQIWSTEFEKKLLLKNYFKTTFCKHYLNKYFACLFVCLCPWTSKRPKSCVWLHMSPENVYIHDQQNSICIKFRKSTIFFLIPWTFCLFLFYNIKKEKMFTIEIEDGCKAPKKSSIISTANIKRK